MDDIKKIFYVYYSFEESGRGYIGYRKCPEGETPETDKYLGTYSDKSFKPIGKTILKRNLTRKEAIAVEIYFQRKYKVAEKWNKDFANLSYQTSDKFIGDNSGKICINNGIKHKYIFPNEEIPDGYIFGRLPSVGQKISEAQKGKNTSEETRKKYSEAKKGKKNPCYGRTGEKNPMFGQTHTEETRKILSERVLGEKNPMFGKTHTEKAKYKSKIKQGIKVITSICCYYSMTDALKELSIGRKKFYKLFEKDQISGFYIERIPK